MGTMSDALYGDNPFRPGFGVSPPYLAGRDGVLREWSKQFRHLTEAGDGGCLLIYGPRGMGKTVLITKFRQDCEKAGIAYASAACNEVLNKREDDMPAQLAHHLTIPGTGGIRVPPPQSGSEGALGPWLTAQAKEGGLVVIIDEAHHVQLVENLNALFNATQDAMLRAPFLLVLVGTPGLMRKAMLCQATFVERAGKIGIGTIDAEAAQEAIARPLAEHVWRRSDQRHLALSDAALEQIATDSQGYPYFLQLWGDSIWDYAVEQDKSDLNEDDIRIIGESVLLSRAAFYGERSGEIKDNPFVLAGAAALARHFLQPDGNNDINTATEEQAISIIAAAQPGALAAALNAAAVESLEDSGERTMTQGIRYFLRASSHLFNRRLRAKMVLQRLTDAGFVWQPPRQPMLHPGIPSYMAYAADLHSGKA